MPEITVSRIGASTRTAVKIVASRVAPIALPVVEVVAAAVRMVQRPGTRDQRVAITRRLVELAVPRRP